MMTKYPKSISACQESHADCTYISATLFVLTRPFIVLCVELLASGPGIVLHAFPTGMLHMHGCRVNRNAHSPCIMRRSRLIEYPAAVLLRCN